MSNNVIVYSNLNALSNGTTLNTKIEDSLDYPFRVNIPQSMILIQLKSALDSETIAMLLKTDFINSGSFKITQRTVTKARTIIKNCTEKGSMQMCLDSLPPKIKLLDMMIQYYNNTNNPTVKENFIIEVKNFIMDYYYSMYADTIVEFTEETEFLKPYIEKSDRYGIEGDAFYLIRLRKIEERMKRFINNGNGMFLSGKAGTGKTTMVKAITNSHSDKRILILAPTNAAVMRLKSIIGESKTITISTIHSARYKESFKTYDMLIIDEASMLSTTLVGMILDLYNDINAKNVIFVGDYRQLPPVEKGNFFKLVLDKYSDKIKHNQLTKIYRQESLDILKLANVFASDDICSHRLSINDICSIIDSESIDVYEYKGYSTTMAKVIKLSSNYNSSYHMVAYTNRTVDNINKISYRLVANKEFDFKDKTKFLIKKLKLRATVTSVSKKNGILYANNQYVEVHSWVNDIVTIRDIFTGDKINIPLRSLNSDFTIGYCSTIHTSQGLGFDTVDFFMSNRNYTIEKELYYTAITRAKKKLNLIKNEFDTNHHLCRITEDIRRTFY
jgi:uncharacterized DUF497 family protein